MFKLTLAICLLMAVVEGSYYGYGYGHSYGRYKRSVGYGEQVHVSGSTGQPVVTAPTHFYGAYYAPHYYNYPRYALSEYYVDPRVTATNAVYSYPRPAAVSYPLVAAYAPRSGYSSGYEPYPSYAYPSYAYPSQYYPSHYYPHNYYSG